MQTINITINNDQSIDFLIELLKKFDFVSEIKLLNTKNQKSKVKNQKKIISSFENHLAELKQIYADLPITWATEEPKIEDFTNIITDRILSLTEIREKSWKRN